MDIRNTPQQSPRARLWQWGNKIRQSSLRPALLPCLLLFMALQLVNAVETRQAGSVNTWLTEVQRGDIPLFFATLGRLKGEGKKWWDSCVEQG